MKACYHMQFLFICTSKYETIIVIIIIDIIIYKMQYFSYLYQP